MVIDCEHSVIIKKDVIKGHTIIELPLSMKHNERSSAALVQEIMVKFLSLSEVPSNKGVIYQ